MKPRENNVATASDSDNPYAAPEEIDARQEGIDVDGESLIVIGRKAKLPDRCVFTNRSTKWYQRTTTLLVWSGKRGQFITRARRCRLKHGLCTPARLRIMMTTASGTLIIGSTLVGLLSFAASNYFGLIVSAMVLVVGFVLGWRADAPVLRIEGWNDDRFIISGCSQEFLDELASDLRTVTKEQSAV